MELPHHVSSNTQISVLVDCVQDILSHLKKPTIVTVARFVLYLFGVIFIFNNMELPHHVSSNIQISVLVDCVQDILSHLKKPTIVTLARFVLYLFGVIFIFNNMELPHHVSSNTQISVLVDCVQDILSHLKKPTIVTVARFVLYLFGVIFIFNNMELPHHVSSNIQISVLVDCVQDILSHLKKPTIVTVARFVLYLFGVIFIFNNMELPHHVSSNTQISVLVDCVQDILSHLKKPTIVTVARFVLYLFGVIFIFNNMELPHHVSSNTQISVLVDCVQDILSHLKKPTIVTVARFVLYLFGVIFIFNNMELPHHVSSNTQISVLVDCVQDILSHLKKPTIVTVARFVLYMVFIVSFSPFGNMELPHHLISNSTCSSWTVYYVVCRGFFPFDDTPPPQF